MNRVWLVWIVALAVLWTVIGRLGEVSELYQTLRGGHLAWVLVAVALQGVYYALFAALYQACFYAVELPRRFRDMYAMTLASMTVSLLVPSAGNALFFDDTLARKQSGARATAAIFLQRASDFGVFWLFLFVGLVWLSHHGRLWTIEILAASVLFVVVLAWAGLLVLGMWRTAWLHAVLAGVERPLGWGARKLRHPEWIGEDWGRRHAEEFADAALFISARPRRLGLVLAVSVAMQVVLIGCLGALFAAFEQPVGGGLLLAGFGVGVLFWVVAITPQGVGVVEGMMAMLFVAFGIAQAKAVTIALAFRGITFWLPVFVGFILLRRVRTFRGRYSSADAGPTAALAIVTALMGLVNLRSSIAGVLGARAALLARLSPLEVRNGGHLAAALAGFALLLLALGLARHKRVAWTVTLGVLAVAATGHLVKGPDWLEAGLALALALWLVSQRRHFHARSDPPAVRAGLVALVVAAGFTLAYGTVGLWVLDQHFQQPFSLRDALRQTLIMCTEFRDPGLLPVTAYARYFVGSVYAIGALTLGYALAMLLRPVVVRAPASPEQRARAAAVVAAHGTGELTLALRLADKSYWFSPGGTLVAHTVTGRVALALGDPVGPAEDLGAALTGFAAHCARNDWLPVWYAASPRYLPACEQAGWSWRPLGESGALDLRGFAPPAHSGQHLRQAAHRLLHTGHHAALHEPPLSSALLAGMTAAGDAWQHGPEQRFVSGGLHADELGGAHAVVVTDAAAHLSAFATLRPTADGHGAVVDLWRARSDAAEGTRELLLLTAVEWAAGRGLATLWLGVRPDAGLAPRVAGRVDSFARFTAPGLLDDVPVVWAPRYLVCPGAAALPAAWLAITRSV